MATLYQVDYELGTFTLSRKRIEGSPEVLKRRLVDTLIIRNVNYGIRCSISLSKVANLKFTVVGTMYKDATDDFYEWPQVVCDTWGEFALSDDVLYYNGLDVYFPSRMRGDDPQFSIRRFGHIRYCAKKGEWDSRLFSRGLPNREVICGTTSCGCIWVPCGRLVLPWRRRPQRVGMWFNSSCTLNYNHVLQFLRGGGTSDILNGEPGDEAWRTDAEKAEVPYTRFIRARGSILTPTGLERQAMIAQLGTLEPLYNLTSHSGERMKWHLASEAADRCAKQSDALRYSGVVK